MFIQHIIIVWKCVLASNILCPIYITAKVGFTDSHEHNFLSWFIYHTLSLSLSLSSTVFLLGLILCLTSSLDPPLRWLFRRVMAWLSIITQIIWPSSSISSSKTMSFSHLLCNLLQGHTAQQDSNALAETLCKQLTLNPLLIITMAKDLFSQTYTKIWEWASLSSSEPIPLFYHSNEYSIWSICTSREKRCHNTIHTKTPTSPICAIMS